MEIGVILLTLGAYGLAIYIGLREKTSLYAVALLAGQLSTLPSPLWQQVYQFNYQETLVPVLTLFGHPLPRAIAFAGWTLMLPPILVVFFSRQNIWFTNYLAGLFLFGVFFIFQIVLESIGSGAGWWVYTLPVLPLRLSAMSLAAAMSALVSLGALTALHLNRHYTFTSLLVFLLPVPLLLRVLVDGLLGAPLYTVLLINRFFPDLAPQAWVASIGVAGTLALLLGGVHVVAGTLARQGDQQALM